MKKIRTYRVKDVARIAGISVRTLHYYDEIGLLVPPTRSDAGYRLYDDDSLLRLQQILIGRELGLTLEEIRGSLDDPNFNHKEALLRQRDALEKRARATTEMIDAVDRALAILDSDEKGDDMTMTEIFDGFDPEDHAAETEARWGQTEAYAESAKRTKSYSPDDWKLIKDQQDAIYSEMAAAMNEDQNPEDVAAMDIAERHRLSIDRWFYSCSHQAHAGLADLYEADSRFAATIDKHGKGLTPFLAAAIRANAKRRA